MKATMVFGCACLYLILGVLALLKTNVMTKCQHLLISFENGVICKRSLKV